MNLFSTMPFRALTGALLLLIVACSHTPPPTQTAPHASQPVTVSKDILSIENLLHSPLEGPSNVGLTIASLREAFGTMEERTGEGLHGNGPVRLSDGYVLASTTVYPNSGTIYVYPQQDPCFSPERAAKITGAVLEPVFRSEHGDDLGHTYNARRNGVWVRFTSTPVTYQCVTAIHIRTMGGAGK